MNLPEYLLSLVLARHGLGNLRMQTAALEMELAVESRVKTILPVQELKKKSDCLFAKFNPFI